MPRDEDMNLVLDFLNGNKNEDENFLAELWIIKFLSANPRVRRSSRIMEKPVSPVPKIIAASKGEGNAVKKKDDTHRMADANKAFAHFRV